MPVFQMFDKTESTATLNPLYIHGSYNDCAEAGQALPPNCDSRSTTFPEGPRRCRCDTTPNAPRGRTATTHRRAWRLTKRGWPFDFLH
jgi:hypothetical protein